MPTLALAKLDPGPHSSLGNIAGGWGQGGGKGQGWGGGTTLCLACIEDVASELGPRVPVC